jgi:hypothetical protein
MDIIGRVTTIGIVAGSVAIAASAQAIPLPTYNTVLGNGGVAIASFVGYEAADTDLLSVVGGLSNFFTNNATPIGTTVTWGSYAFGVEIEFTLADTSVPDTWFSGPGSRDPDGVVHADVTTSIADIAGLPAASYAYAATLPAGTVFVGFEDRPGNQADFDYNDMVFAVQNARTSIPEPASFAMLGSCLAGFVVLRRRKPG